MAKNDEKYAYLNRLNYRAARGIAAHGYGDGRARE